MEKLRCFRFVAKLFFRIDKFNTVVFVTGSALAVVLLFSQLYLVKFIVDSLQDKNVLNTLKSTLTLIGCLGAVLYLEALISTARAFSITRLTEAGLFEQENMLLQKTARLPLAALEAPAVKTAREKAAKISLYNILDQAISCFTGTATLMILLIVVTVQGHWIFTAVAVVAFLVQVFTHSKAERGLEIVLRKQAASRRFVNYFADILTSKTAAQEIRVFGLADYLLAKWKELLIINRKEAVAESARGELIKAAPNLVVALLSGVSAAVLVIVLGIRGQSAGQFTLLFQMTALLFTQMPALARLHGSLTASIMKYHEFDKYMRLEEDSFSAPSKQRSVSMSEPLAFRVEQLSFQYPGNSVRTLNNISFVIDPKQKVAIVGENGSGKSTLIKLLLGMYKPTTGSVSWLAGAEKITRNDMLGSIRIIFQDFSRLLRTVRENVAVGDIDKLHCDADIDRALTEAGATAFIAGKDVQLGTGFGGVNLSGGQWQAVAAARAWLKDATCTICDEPTAALDARAELEVFRTMLELVKGQTAIIVTHRLGAARLADWILVLKNGQLVECGSHSELVNRNGEYRRLYELQASWYK